jgi:hypothetical protein
LKRHRNSDRNSERNATNFKVKQETINKEIYEIKNTAQEIKEEFNKDMQNLRKKSDRNPGNKISFNQKKKKTQ